MKRGGKLLAVAAVAIATTSGAAAADQGKPASVVTYRCDGDRWIAVAYPAESAGPRAPIRITWEGRTVELSPTRASRGSSFVNAMASLEWWRNRESSTLRTLHGNRPLLTNCVEA
jgi:hypothetical protein